MSAELTDLQDAFRAAMAGVCTPVSVVTTVEGGRPHGTTVSAFTSLSMAPPMVLVSLDRGSDLLSMVRRTGTFGLNVLASGQSALASRFARKGPEKFSGADWSNEFGAARLCGVAAWVACTVGQIVEGGDHLVLLGDVVAAEATESEPLTYHARTFGTHLRHAEAS
jgi:flavin reductase (DIM6/NTAB) family NADH-FMN oxidoreductase RutF